MRPIGTPNTTILLTIIGLIGLLGIPTWGHAQQISQVKEKIDAKIKAISDTIASRRLYIKGQAATQLHTTYSKDGRPSYDYFINVNLEATYKGVRLPFSYVFSNGRSVYRFQGPSYRTPSFAKFGLSPNYKGYKLHLGSRTMDFSKYTFQQVRFEGVGFETPEKGVYGKVFSGKLKLVDPADLLFTSAIDPTYTRTAWGTLLGYSNERAEAKIIIFKARDQLDSLLQDTILVLPKENTVISASMTYKPFEKLSIQFEQSLSALTSNSLSPRVDILTPQSMHNMLGLFEKKLSSDYFQAQVAEIAYTLGEQKCGYNFERVDKNYRSLGSLFYDHNFIEHRLFVSGIWQEKLTYSVSGGIRQNHEKQDTLPRHSKFVFQSMVAYQWNERFSTYGSFNNLKTVQQEYYRSFQSNSIDSLSLSQVNTAFALGSAYQINTPAPIQLNALFSTQQSNGIENELVSNTNTRSHIISFGYNQQFEKRNLQSTCSFISTSTANYQNTTWQVSVLYGQVLSDKLKVNSNLQYQAIRFGPDNINQVIQRNTLDISFSKRITARAEVGLDFTDSKGPFQLDRVSVRLDSHYTF